MHKKRNKKIVKTRNFIEELKSITCKFDSKSFLKKPLQEMLSVFYDPSMTIPDEGSVLNTKLLGIDPGMKLRSQIFIC